MDRALLQDIPFPRRLNLGSGKDFRDDCFNLDVDDGWGPDAVCDLSTVRDIASGVPLRTIRFGDVVLLPGSFDTIIANDVLEHVPDLMAMMTACLGLLRVGGVFEISVPYDLSYGAWQDPTHVRAFNERSWLYYTDWFWYMGWSEHRFEIASFTFVPSPLGEALKDKDLPRDDVLRTPRAIDSMAVSLRKIVLTADDRATWEHWRERKRLARQRGTAIAEAPRTPSEAPVPGQSNVTWLTPSPSTPLKAFGGTLAESLHRHCIWIVSPANYCHHHAYDDVALALSDAFAELGGSAPVVHDLMQAGDRAPIVFGPQLLTPETAALLPPQSVLFNLEQTGGNSPWMHENYLSLLRQRPVLDYSQRNQAALSHLGVGHARLLPIGYAPGLSRIVPAVMKDIDVLFYGCLNERRLAIIDGLKARGINVVWLFEVFGAERDAMIARSKIVLNMHFYDAAIFESVRVSYLLANGACVVSEGDANDPDTMPFAGGLALVPYDEIIARCVRLLAKPYKRTQLERAGLDVIKRQRQSTLLKALFVA